MKKEFTFIFWKLFFFKKINSKKVSTHTQIQKKNSQILRLAQNRSRGYTLCLKYIRKICEYIRFFSQILRLAQNCSKRYT
jgi:hypothetical protein